MHFGRIIDGICILNWDTLVRLPVCAVLAVELSASDSIESDIHQKPDFLCYRKQNRQSLFLGAGYYLYASGASQGYIWWEFSGKAWRALWSSSIPDEINKGLMRLITREETEGRELWGNTQLEGMLYPTSRNRCVCEIVWWPKGVAYRI